MLASTRRSSPGASARSGESTARLSSSLPARCIKQGERATILVRPSLFLRPPAPTRGPQKSDQQQDRCGPLKPDVVEAAEQVDQKQEDDDGDHHGAETRQPYVPFPGAREEAGQRTIRGRRRCSGLPSPIGLRSERPRRGAALNDAIARYRVGDVLQLLSAEAVEPDG